MAEQWFSQTTNSKNESFLEQLEHNEKLIVAADKGDLEEVIRLVNEGAGIDHQNTTLKMAAMNGHLEVVKYLVEHFHDSNAVRYASSKGHLDIVKFLVSQGSDIRSHDCVLAFYRAAEDGNFEIVEYFVDQGADIKNDNNAIYWACVKGDLKMVKFLVSRGADIITQPVVIWACDRGHFEIVKYLLSQGADVEFFDEAEGIIYRRCRNYLSFCDRMEERKKVRAEKKIYFWWIQICYDQEHHSGCGKRILEQSWSDFDKIQKKETPF